MIRIASPNDASAIHTLHTRSVRNLCSQDYPEEVIEGWLQGRSPSGYKERGIMKKEMYVLEEHGLILGFSHVTPSLLAALFVDPDHVRKGVGRALFEHALTLLRSQVSKSESFEATLTALPFYLKMGCTEIRRSFVEKNKIQIEAVLLQLPARPEHSSHPTKKKS